MEEKKGGGKRRGREKRERCKGEREKEGGGVLQPPALPGWNLKVAPVH